MASKLGFFSEGGWKKGLKELDAWMEGRPSAFKKIPVERVSAADVRKVREKVGLTQEKFAAVLGVNPVTVRFWESGRRNPDGLACKVLRLIARHPELAGELARV